MRQLLRGRRANIDHGAIEAQPLTGQRMIAVDDDPPIGDVRDGKDPALETLIAVVRRPLELHPDFHLAREPVLRLDAHQLGVVLAERVLGLEHDRALIACSLFREGGLDLREDALMTAVEIHDRLLRLLDQRAFGGVQLVGKRDDAVGNDIHDQVRPEWRSAPSTWSRRRSFYPQRVRAFAKRGCYCCRYNRSMERALLGGMTATQFLRRHWQKKPLLVRQAIPGFAGLLSMDALSSSPCATTWNRASYFGSAGAGRSRTALSVGRIFRALPARGWTLLVQGVNLHIAAGRCAAAPLRLSSLRTARRPDGELRRTGRRRRSALRFLRRLSAPGRRRRRWRVGRQRVLTLEPGVPLKILARFLPERSWVLEPGDMLLPSAASCARRHGGRCLHDLLDRLSRAVRAGTLPSRFSIGCATASRSTDATPTATSRAEPRARADRIGDARARARDVAPRAVGRRVAATFLGSYLTEPKQAVTFEPPARPLDVRAFRRAAVQRGLRLDSATQLLYDDRQLFINGEAMAWPARGSQLLKRLANHRQVGSAEPAQPQPSPLLHRWYCDGFVRLD